jgi:hypothetical protein
MKVLIDECAPKALKVALAARGFDCTTVQEAGFVDLFSCWRSPDSVARNSYGPTVWICVSGL